MRHPLAEALGASATFLLTTNDCGGLFVDDEIKCSVI